MKNIGGMQFKDATDDEVIRILVAARRHKTRIRIFYGNRETGIDWCEEYDTQGYIGSTTGSHEALLLRNSASRGGCLLLTENILKITIDKKVVYIHKNYKEPKFDIVKNGSISVVNKSTRQICANCVTESEAQNYIDFMRGLRNKVK